VAESLDKVQQATEDYFAGIRRTVLDFDEVLNKQRQELYRRRQAILLGDAESTGTLMRQLCRATVDDILPGYVGKGPGGSLDAAGLSAKIMQFFPTADSQKLQELDSKALSSGALAKHLHEVAEAAWVAKLEELEAKKAGLGWITARYLLLTQYDNLWSDHLEAMNMLRENVSMERFSGNDPLNEFKIQGGELFRGIFDTARLNTVFSFFVYKPTPKKQ
jgi:preprotein translocase subunit SecA